MIFVGLGGNLPHPELGAPPAAAEAALEMLGNRGVRVVRRSPWYRSAPVPASGQPDFVNGVVEVATELSPAALLRLLHEIEAELGRRRSSPNAARIIDLDLLDFGGRIMTKGDDGPELPHPRMADRAFVLLPLRDVAPDWRHPGTGRGIDDLISGLSEDQFCERLRDR